MKLSTHCNKKIITKCGVVFFWIMAWQVVHYIVGKDILVPSFYATMGKVFELFGQVSFYYDIGMTFYRVFIGVMISFVLGSLSALMAYFLPIIKELFVPFITTLKSTPVMAVIILALLWFTKNNVPIFVCFLMCYPVVYTNILKGLQEVNKDLLEMAYIFKVKQRYILKDLYLPQIRPYIESALGMIIGLSWKVVIAAEVLAVPKYSMGYNLLSAKSYLETETLFAWVVIIVILSSLCEMLVAKLIRRGGNKI